MMQKLKKIITSISMGLNHQAMKLIAGIGFGPVLQRAGGRERRRGCLGWADGGVAHALPKMRLPRFPLAQSPARRVMAR